VLAQARRTADEMLAHRLANLDVRQTKRLVLLLQRFVTGD
jgi:hypothetical protein